MGATFWIKRYFVVLCGAFVIISGAQLLKGNDLSYSFIHGGIWAFITASIFVASRIYQSRKGQHCAICQDTPEMKK